MRVHSQRSHHTEVINVVMRASVPITTRVVIGPGALETVPNILSQSDSGRRVLVLVQNSIAARWGTKIFEILTDAQYQTTLMQLPDGEQCKQYENLLSVWQKLQELQFTRADAIVAVGGGAISDLAGFAASTYLRGVKLVLVATTLLAQVDAAIGGKTGINLPAGKNLAGTFYFPAGVVVDPLVLATLPQREIASGLGEIIKYAFMESTIIANTDYRGGPRLFFDVLEDLLSNSLGSYDAADPSLTGIIAACVKMKLAVVAKDPYEGRLRRCLNLGHTLGHAIEKASDYSLTHGECVAIGLVFACKLSQARGTFDDSDVQRLLKILNHAGLPSTVPAQYSSEQLAHAMSFDKKKTGEHIKFVLPIKPLGVVDLDAALKVEEIEELLR